MSKTMQNITLFMDATRKDYETHLKSGNSFMNRFSIEEDAAFEIIGIHHLETYQPFIEDSLFDLTEFEDVAFEETTF